MDLGALYYRNKIDGFTFKVREGSMEQRSLSNHKDYERVEIEAAGSQEDQLDGEEQLENQEDDKDLEDPIEDEPVDFQSYTVDQLKGLAKELGIAGYSSMKKDDLIAAIIKDD